MPPVTYATGIGVREKSSTLIETHWLEVEGQKGRAKVSPTWQRVLKTWKSYGEDLLSIPHQRSQFYFLFK